MKKVIILLFAFYLLSSCKPTVDYEIPSEVETMATSRFNKASGIFYEIQKTHGTTESPIIGSKKYTLYIEAKHRATGTLKIFISEYKKSGDSYEYIGTSEL